MKGCRLVVLRCIIPSMLNCIFNLSLSLTQNILWLTLWSIFHLKLPRIETALFRLQVPRLRLLVFVPRVINSKVKMSKMHWWDGTILTGDTEVLAHELSQPVPASSCSPQMSVPGSKPDLRGDRPANDRLSHGTVHSYFGLNAFVTKNTVCLIFICPCIVI